MISLILFFEILAFCEFFVGLRFFQYFILFVRAKLKKKKKEKGKKKKNRTAGMRVGNGISKENKVELRTKW